MDVEKDMEPIEEAAGQDEVAVVRDTNGEMMQTNEDGGEKETMEGDQAAHDALELTTKALLNLGPDEAVAYHIEWFESGHDHY